MIFINDNIKNITIEEYQCAFSKLSEQRRNYVLRYHKYEDRVRSVFAYDLLVNGLKSLYNINELPIFNFNQYGKPFLENIKNLYFSLSHCENAIVCSLAENDVGIDVEDIKPIDIGYFNDMLSEKEFEYVRTRSDKAVAFASIWTRKESLAKLIGKGISSSFKEIVKDEDTFQTTTIIDIKKKIVISESTYHCE